MADRHLVKPNNRLPQDARGHTSGPATSISTAPTNAGPGFCFGRRAAVPPPPGGRCIQRGGVATASSV